MLKAPPLAGPWNAPFVRPSNCATMKLCGVHGEVDKRDKCRERLYIYIIFRDPLKDSIREDKNNIKMG